ncbi:EAL domain-containing protein [Wenzhouxiangella marina]|nr:EAL domain-containing protein [Wenzhouxiangella marina]MBB6086526.1 sensor c-di-GMP phosphodiesterase-like protein [Wenzhouxiangella marina]
MPADTALSESAASPRLRDSASRSLASRPLIWLAAAAFSVVGALFGWWVAERLDQARTATLIDQSTQRVLERLDDIIGEALDVFDSLAARGHAHCSEAQIQDMRTLLFEARYLRDIGGVRGYSLYCSTALGSLEEPYHSTAPPLRLDGGIGLRTDRTVLASAKLRSMVVERGDFNALVDSRQVIDLVTGLDQAHIEVAVASDSPRQWLPFSLLTRPDNGVFRSRPESRAQCSEQTGICARIRLGLSKPAATGATHAVIAGLGGALGGSLFMIAVSLWRQRNTPERALRQALKEGWIRPAYQPIVTLPGRKLAAFEALARWKNERGQTVPADQFIPLAESQGLIREVSAVMIRSIGEELGDWLAAQPQLRLTLNISPDELSDPSLVGQIERHLLARGIQPGQIVLEITERTMLAGEASRASIERLAAMGLTLFADDFGVGYCGLAYLNELDIHGIKICQQLTAAVATDSPKAVLVPRVTEMARELGLEVVIEGVETQEQRDALAALEPVLVQGWLFAREVDAEQLKRLYEDR